MFCAEMVSTQLAVLTSKTRQRGSILFVGMRKENTNDTPKRTACECPHAQVYARLAQRM